MAILVDIGFKKMGEVTICDVVKSASKSYQEGQDVLTKFDRDCIEEYQTGRITKSQLKEKFSEWFGLNIGGKEPKTKEIIEYMNGRYGPGDKLKGWTGIKLKPDATNEQEEDVEL
jgi:hypothetical protein